MIDEDPTGALLAALGKPDELRVADRAWAEA
jgi:hypothetical protein